MRTLPSTSPSATITKLTANGTEIQNHCDLMMSHNASPVCNHEKIMNVSLAHLPAIFAILDQFLIQKLEV